MAGAQTAKPDTENKHKLMASRGGKKFVSKSREYLHSVEGISNVIFYELSESIEAKNLGFDQDMPAFVDSNIVGLPCPSIYYGTPEFKTKVREYSDAVAKIVVDHFLETASPEQVTQFLSNQKLRGATLEEKSEIMKGYLLLDHLIHISPNESEDLNKDQQIKLLLELKTFVQDKITNGNSDKFFNMAIPHIKYDQKKDVYKSHLHCKISSIDFDGNKLGLHNIGLRFNWAMIEAENSPQFKDRIMLTNTTAAERNFMPKSEKAYDDFRKVFGSYLFSKTSLTPDQVSFRLKKKNVEIVEMPALVKYFDEDGETQFKEHDTLKRYIAKYDGKMYDVKYLKDSDAQKIRSTISYENSSPESKNQIDIAKEIILSKKFNDFTSLNNELESQGIVLLPNITKSGKLQGFSVFLNNGETRTTLSNLQIQISDLNIDAANPEHIQMLHDLRRKNLQHGKKPNSRNQFDDGSVELSGFGIHQPFRKRKLMKDYESIDEWMLDAGGSYDISLKKYYYFDENTSSFLHKKYNNPIFKITEHSDSTLKTSFTGASFASATALIQMYLENGYSSIKISGDPKKCSMIWRAAMQKGVAIEGYNPSREDLEWFKVERDKQVKEVRNINQKAFEAFKTDGTGFDIKIVSNTYKEVDRSPIAYAFVDLLNVDENPLQVLKPPKHKSKNKATDQDLTDQYYKILEIVKSECPEKMLAAEQFLKNYKPLDLIQKELAYERLQFKNTETLNENRKPSTK